MMKNKILVLYSEVMGYTLACLKELSKKDNVEVHVVHWDKNKLTPFKIENDIEIKFYNRSEYNYKSLLHIVKGISPSIIYTSGIMDKDYMKICKIYKKKGIPTISGFDTQWDNKKIKHWLGALLYKITLKPYFKYIWVAGIRQYELARRCNYSINNILLNLYSCDVDLFNKAYIKDKAISKNILFIGRYSKEKGINNLLEVFMELDTEEWKLTLVGNGPLKKELKNKSKDNNKVIFKNFMQPKELLEEIKNTDICILPSSYEPFGVVIHEYTSAGKPIITSDSVGAVPTFVRNGYNGYIFKKGDKEGLKNKLNKMMNLSKEELNLMGRRSYELSKSITPTMWAETLMSVIE